MKSRLFVIGHTLLDIVFENNVACRSKPGGTAVNTSVGCAQLGGNVSLVSSVGDDQVGQLLTQYLEQYGVDTRLMARSNQQTRIALAFVDAEKQASYDYYGAVSNKLLADAVSQIKATERDIIYFGGSNSTVQQFQEVLTAIPRSSLVYFDPNVRRAVDPETFAMCVAACDILRLSADDLQRICAQIPDFLAAFDQRKTLLVTYVDRVSVFHSNTHVEHKFAPIRPKTTVGAGDAFNAGCLATLLSLNPSKDLEAAPWEDIVAAGIKHAHKVCMTE